MTITFDIKELKEKHNCVNFFETGLWDARSDVSSKQALRAGFEKVFCIELRDQWIEIGNQVFANEIKEEKYYLYHDDSVNMAKYLNPVIDELLILKRRRCFFWSVILWKLLSKS